MAIVQFIACTVYEIYTQGGGPTVINTEPDGEGSLDSGWRIRDRIAI